MITYFSLSHRRSWIFVLAAIVALLTTGCDFDYPAGPDPKVNLVIEALRLQGTWHAQVEGESTDKPGLKLQIELADVGHLRIVWIGSPYEFDAHPLNGFGKDILQLRLLSGDGSVETQAGPAYQIARYQLQEDRLSVSFLQKSALPELKNERQAAEHLGAAIRAGKFSEPTIFRRQPRAYPPSQLTGRTRDEWHLRDEGFTVGQLQDRNRLPVELLGKKAQLIYDESSDYPRAMVATADLNMPSAKIAALRDLIRNLNSEVRPVMIELAIDASGGASLITFRTPVERARGGTSIANPQRHFLDLMIARDELEKKLRTEFPGIQLPGW